MTVVRYEPWGFLNRFYREAANPVNPSVAWLPSVDVREEDNRFVVQVDLPGVESKDIEITAEKGVLTIRGERRVATRDESNAYRRLERHSGKFLRRFTLPDSANLESITAKHTHGVLEVTIPKQAKLQPRRIEVAAA